MTDVAIVTKADREAATAIMAKSVIYRIWPADAHENIASGLAEHAHPLRVALEACATSLQKMLNRIEVPRMDGSSRINSDISREEIQSGLQASNDARTALGQSLPEDMS